MSATLFHYHSKPITNQHNTQNTEETGGVVQVVVVPSDVTDRYGRVLVGHGFPPGRALRRRRRRHRGGRGRKWAHACYELPRHTDTALTMTRLRPWPRPRPKERERESWQSRRPRAILLCTKSLSCCCAAVRQSILLPWSGVRVYATLCGRLLLHSLSPNQPRRTVLFSSQARSVEIKRCDL